MSEKQVLWAIKIPRSLKQRVRHHIKKSDDWTMKAFAIKSVEYLLRSEQPIRDGKGNSSPLLIQVYPDFDKRARTLARTNYPSMSCLIRTAILKQLILEEQEENRGKWTPPKSHEDLLINLLCGKIVRI